MIAKHLVVKGKVQGVYFRASTKNEAIKYGLMGWVKNTTNGNVEIHIQGMEIDVQKLIHWTKSGPPLAKVSEVQITEAAIAEFDSFRIER